VTVRNVATLCALRSDCSSFDLLMAYDKSHDAGLERKEFMVMMKRITDDEGLWYGSIRPIAITIFEETSGRDGCIDIEELERLLSLDEHRYDEATWIMRSPSASAHPDNEAEATTPTSGKSKRISFHGETPSPASLPSLAAQDARAAARREIRTPELLARIRKNVVWGDEPTRSVPARLHAHAQRLPATAAAAARAATPRAIFSSQRMRRLQMVAVRAVEAAEHTRSPDNGHPKVASPSGRVQAVAEEAMAVAAEAARSAGRRQVAKEEMKRLEGIRRLRLEERERREAFREEAQRQEDDARESRRQAMIIGEPSAAASSSALSPLRKARSLGGKLGGGGAAVMWPGAGFTRSRSDPGLLGPLQRRREKNYESGRMGGAKVEGFPRISRTGKVIRTTESFLRK
jgi:hypothetical protein